LAASNEADTISVTWRKYPDNSHKKIMDNVPSAELSTLRPVYPGVDRPCRSTGGAWLDGN
jgi:hypothetical protein